MAHITKPRVGETTTTTGTGALALGGALTAHQRFSAVCSVSDTVFYDISAVDANGAETGDWEEGLGTYSAANELTRTTVLASSTGGAVSFAAGTKYVRLVAEARQIASVPRGGSSGQFLKKGSATDYDESWATIASADVSGLGTLATQNGTFSGTSSGTNTGDQTSIVGITGSLAEFNAALTGADFATGGGTVTGASSGTNTGDETGARVATLLHAASSKATLVDADELGGTDSANSFSLIRVTFANLKATLKTYLDTLYSPIVAVISATPSTDQNDYAPTGWSTCTTLRLNHSAPIVITGFAAGTAGEKKTITNVTAEFPAIIADEAVTSSSAANRVKVNASGFAKGHAVLLPGGSVQLEYDGTSSRWRFVADNCMQPIRSWMHRPMRARPGSNALDSVGLLTATELTIVTANLSSGSFKVEVPRQTHQTGTGAGASAGVRTSTNVAIIGDAAGRGGFMVRTWFMGGANPADAGSSFIGVAAQTGAIGNVDASSLINMIGVGSDPTQNAFRRLHNDGSGTATANSLGSNFAWATAQSFDHGIYASPNASNVVSWIWRTDDLSIVPLIWTDSSDIPANTVTMSWHFHVGNRAAAAAYGLDLAGGDIFTPN